jgi:Fe-S cluster biogenesis protein NfuA
MLPSDLELGLDAQRLLNSTIRPLLNVDAGDAEVTSVVDGHVTITLLGSCGRCLFRASCASYTVLDRLERTLGDRGTYAVSGVSISRERSRLTPATSPAPLRTTSAGASAGPREQEGREHHGKP